MNIILVIAITLPVWFLFVGFFINYKSSQSEDNYFGFGQYDPKLKFFLKKHDIFRRVALLYIGLHYLISILAVIFTLMTVYMILDKSIGIYWQVLFLLMAAILSALSCTLNLDDLAKVYFQAMRILETAILQYRETNEVNTLIEANKEAETFIGEKFV